MCVRHSKWRYVKAAGRRSRTTGSVKLGTETNANETVLEFQREKEKATGRIDVVLTPC